MVGHKHAFSKENHQDVRLFQATPNRTYRKRIGSIHTVREAETQRTRTPLHPFFTFFWSSVTSIEVFFPGKTSPSRSPLAATAQPRFFRPEWRMGEADET